MQRGGTRHAERRRSIGYQVHNFTYLAVRVVVVEQRRRREHRVVVLQQLRPEAILVLPLVVVVPAVRRGLGRGVGQVVRRSRAGDGDDGFGRRGRAAGAEPLGGAAVKVGRRHSGVGGAGEVLRAVLGGVGVAAGELLDEGAETCGASLDAHGVGDVHHLDGLLALAAAALVLPRRGAAPPAPRSIASGTVLLPLAPLLVVHRSAQL